jgi:NADH dehydrogenase [ubiquinone] 1 alpha subcomplex assembly factor 1
VRRTSADRIARVVVVVIVVASVGATGCASGRPTASTLSSVRTTPTGFDVTTTLVASTPTANLVTLVDFADQAAADSWSSQNDTVMGGKSRGTASWVDGALVFGGSLSLENNGGFSSVVGNLGQRVSRDVTPIKSISISASGDGKTYVLQLRTDDDSVRYAQRFTTEAGVERTYSLALAAFEPVNFQLSPLKNAPPLDPFALTGLALYILDKQAGPFELNVRRIDAIG